MKLTIVDELPARTTKLSHSRWERRLKAVCEHPGEWVRFSGPFKKDSASATAQYLRSRYAEPSNGLDYGYLEAASRDGKVYVRVTRKRGRPATKHKKSTR